MNSALNILIPQSFGGKDGQQALKEILEQEKAKSESQTASSHPEKVIGDLECFYEPRNNLYFRQNPSFNDFSWDRTHSLLAGSGWRMPTILEFIMLLNGMINKSVRSPEEEEFLDRVLAPGEESQVLLDNQFEIRGGMSFMNSRHTIARDSNGKEILGYGISQPLPERCLILSRKDVAHLGVYETTTGFPFIHDSLKFIPRETIEFCTPYNERVTCLRRDKYTSVLDCTFERHVTHRTCVYACCGGAKK